MVFQTEIDLPETDGDTIDGVMVGRVDVVVGAVVVVVVVVGIVGISIGTMIPVRIRLTTVFINGYRPRLQKLPEKSSRSGAHIITPPRSFPII
jgi:hypothetical protein